VARGHTPITKRKREQSYERANQKKKTGPSRGRRHQCVCQDRIELRVNQQEKIRIAQLAKERGFETVAQYVRCVAIEPGSESPSAQRQAQYACMHQLNRMGINVNQIARHLNSGGQLDEEIRQTLAEIMEYAEALCKNANATPKGAQ
jgi:hypothetical protein